MNTTNSLDSQVLNVTNALIPMQLKIVIFEVQHFSKHDFYKQHINRFQTITIINNI